MFIETFNKELKIEEKLKKQTLKATSPKMKVMLYSPKSKRRHYNNKTRHGGAVVIDVDDYICEANTQLNNHRFLSENTK